MTDQLTNVPHAGTHLLDQMLRMQLQWQRLFWRVPMEMFGAGWVTTARGKHASAEVVDCVAHGQLAVPTDGGKHQLFA